MRPLHSALRARLALLALTLTCIAALSLFMSLFEPEPTLMDRRVRSVPLVVGVPLVGWGLFRVVRPPRAYLSDHRAWGSVSAAARFDWDLRTPGRYSTGRILGVGYVRRRRNEGERTIQYLFLTDESVAAVTVVLEDLGRTGRPHR
ncbi:MAG: hypothetical protein AAGA90_19725 [Actinomycetota bacterium]